LVLWPYACSFRSQVQPQPPSHPDHPVIPSSRDRRLRHEPEAASCGPEQRRELAGESFGNSQVRRPDGGASGGRVGARSLARSRLPAGNRKASTAMRSAPQEPSEQLRCSAAVVLASAFRNAAPANARDQRPRCPGSKHAGSGQTGPLPARQALLLSPSTVCTRATGLVRLSAPALRAGRSRPCRHELCPRADPRPVLLRSGNGRPSHRRATPQTHRDLLRRHLQPHPPPRWHDEPAPRLHRAPKSPTPRRRTSIRTPWTQAKDPRAPELDLSMTGRPQSL